MYFWIARQARHHERGADTRHEQLTHPNSDITAQGPLFSKTSTVDLKGRCFFISQAAVQEWRHNACDFFDRFATAVLSMGEVQVPIFTAGDIHRLQSGFITGEAPIFFKVSPDSVITVVNDMPPGGANVTSRNMLTAFRSKFPNCTCKLADSLAATILWFCEFRPCKPWAAVVFL